jgi:plastocyanin
VATVAAIGLAIPVQLERGQTGVEAAASASHPSAVKVVVINNFAFMPMTVTVSAGTTVVWVNRQTGVPHTVTADNGSFTSRVITTGKFYAHRFTAAGTVTYHCAIHPFMKAAVIVQ